jgi:DBF zinc finger
LENLHKKKTPEEKNPEVIEEPKPGPTHLFCAICKEQFKDYITHIFSMNHRTMVRTGQNLQIYQDIDKALVDINLDSRLKE